MQKHLNGFLLSINLLVIRICFGFALLSKYFIKGQALGPGLNI